MLKKLLQFIIFSCIATYPVLVYFSINRISFTHVLVALLLLLIVKYFVFGQKEPQKNQLLLIAAAVVCLVINLFINDELGIRIYPVLVNLTLLTIFALSLLNPPSMIERFARITDKNLSQQGVDYTRKVTIVWCLFFIVNASISSYTACCSSLEVWTIYNGAIAYILIGALMAGEFLVRIQVKKKHLSNTRSEDEGEQ